MSTSAERGQQSQPTATVYHPQLKLTVSDLATNAAAAAHLAASTNTSGLVAAGNTLVGLNPFLRTSAAVSLNSMQIQRPPSFLTSSNQSTVTRGSDGSASVQASSVLKSSGNVIARDLYPQHHLSNFTANLNLSGSSTYLPNAQHNVHTQAQFQRLKVEDALSYLDQVKLQFGSKPHVYNDFLDIMKEFKSQAIDTPGVIQRVSHLFRGHPNLIVGFNTFLPPGYKIEVHGECGERVSISTPSGQSHIIAPEEQQTLNNHVGSTLNVTSSATTNDNRSVIVNGQNKPVAAVQPLEFNHAISYVNKIKMRFINQPEVYKNFLEILHTYQKEQREIKEGSVAVGRRTLSEREVYDMVARLFANEEDLLREFSQFLPDATAQCGLIQVQQAIQVAPQLPTVVCSSTSASASSMSVLSNPLSSTTLLSHYSSAPISSSSNYQSSPSSVNSRPYAETSSPMKQISSASPRPDVSVIKRSAKESPKEISSSPPKKQARRGDVLNADMNVGETVTCGSLHEYEFFDKIRKSIKDDESYRNFLRLLMLYNQEIISKTDLMQLLTPIFGKHVEFCKWFRDFLGCNDVGSTCNDVHYEKPQPEERIVSDLAMEIDYASCTRYGLSYRALPKSYVQPKCSGRTALCDEVLNDTWVSFPSWQSEDTPFISSKKSQYEESIYRTEDERFELDNVIETNNSTIETLEEISQRLSNMSQEEAKRFQLDDCLGGRTQTIHKRVIKRIYGDKALDVIEGLTKNPSVVVPIVLERLKAKDQEWRDAKKSFNRIWREQNEKHYWKSLDHQGLNFKQNDLKFIRSKALLNQIETLFDDRRELLEEGVTPVPNGPHMEFFYPKDGSVFYDVNDLLIHHVKRQAGLQKDEKYKIKKLLKVTLPQLFGFQCETLSDDENGSDEKDDDEQSVDGTSNRMSNKNCVKRKLKESTINDGRNSSSSEYSECVVVRKVSYGLQSNPKNKNDYRLISKGVNFEKKFSLLLQFHCFYSLIMLTNPWYVFLRLHQILSERLSKLKSYCNQMVMNEKLNAEDEARAPAECLKCRPKSVCQPKEYYPTLIQLIKNVLDGQIDNAQFEDNLRDLFIIHAYIAFTMDRIVQTMVKQLQMMVTEETGLVTLELYDKWCALGGAGHSGGGSVIERKLLEEQYQKEAEHLSTDQNSFKTIFYHDEQKVSFELLDTDSDEPNDESNLKQKTKLWTLSYAREFMNGSNTSHDALVDILDALIAKPVFLCRNIRKTKAAAKQSSRKSSREEKHLTAEGDKCASTPISNDLIPTDQEPTTSTEYKIHNDDIITPIVDTCENRTSAAYINNRLKILYVPRSNEDMYRRGALFRAQKTRLKSTEVRNRRFYSWHDRWTLANVSMDKARLTDDWFMGRSEEMNVDSTSICIQRIQESASNRPPTLALYRYLSPQSQNPSMIGFSQIR